MHNYSVIGKSIPRKEGKDKVTGYAKYTNDFISPDMLYARLLTSPHAHAIIKSIDVSEAQRIPGVRAILTGKSYPCLTGSTIMDKPIIAIDKVRHHGETVAVVVADTELDAAKAVSLIKVYYEPLPVVNSPSEGFKNNSPLVHEKLQNYRLIYDVYPIPGTNIANWTKIRKGDIRSASKDSDVTIDAYFSFPQSDHAAMETRCVFLQILPNGQVVIFSSTQSPFAIKKTMSTYFNIDIKKVSVNVPLVGGAYGGKTPVHLEPIAYIASKAVGGRMVKLTNTREDDFINSPVHIGLDAKVTLGCTKDGILKAALITYLFDGGAFADRAVIISRAAAVDCTGPYRIDNVWCDSYCIYTNHSFATAFRGFGHSELTFVMERAMDMLADKLGIDPLELRYKNAIAPGDSTPTQTVLNTSNVGNLRKCLLRLSELTKWNEGDYIKTEKNKVIAKGVSCLWKTSNTPTNAGAGAILTFNSDGSINLNCGAVELGQGTKTELAQIVAEKLKMSADRINVFIGVNTELMPDHWKTAASRSIYMVGRAVINAAQDAINQLIRTASIVLRALEEDLEVGCERVYLRSDPMIGIDIKDIAHGYTYPNGNSIMGQVIGRGSYILHGLTNLDPNTGKGKPGPEWTVAAQAVEVELDTRDYTYKILKAATVIDAGKVINYMIERGQMTGGMNMGLSFASREGFVYSKEGVILDRNLRTYKINRFGDNPKYLVDFIETPDIEGPYGARGIGEHGVIGMPAALANCLSRACGVPLNILPLIPETIWRIVKEQNYDTL